MREQDFSDAEHDISNARGILDGDAFRDHEKVRESLSRDGSGFDLQVYCNNCGKPCVVSIPWPELIVASMSVLPADMQTNQPWMEHRGFMYPPVRCGCGQMLNCPVTPDKAARFLDTGVKAGRISPQQIDMGRRQVAARAPRR